MEAVRRRVGASVVLAMASVVALAAEGAEQVTRVIDISLTESEEVPSLSVAKQRLTTLSFVDTGGAPWSIARIVTSKGAPVVDMQESHPHVALLHGGRGDESGNLVAMLEGLEEPIHLQFDRSVPTASGIVVRVDRPRPAVAIRPEGEPAAPAMSRGQVEAIVRDYVSANPDLIREALDPSRQLLSKTLELRDELVGAEGVPATGDLSGAVTIVEFFDYRCGFCKRSLAAVRAAASMRGVRLELRDYPILGEDSVTASRLALAAGMQGRYVDAHYALMEQSDGFGDPELPDRLAAALGLDAERLRDDMESPEVTSRIDANQALARRLGVTGTPAFLVIGPDSAQVSPGALDRERLREMVVVVQWSAGALRMPTGEAT